MAKISQYTGGDPPQATDKLVIARSGANRNLAGSLLLMPVGTLFNGRVNVSVSSNNITVSIKTLAGTDPSSSDPVFVRFEDAIRQITSALSVTKNAGTNWFNSGSSELATQLINYFVYLGYNATDGVVIGFSRIPYSRTYGTFSATTTNEKYAAISTIANAVSTDQYVNVGRISATLSATASFNWSISGTGDPISRPIFETDLLTWSPVHTRATTPYTNTPTVNTATYQIIARRCVCNERHTQNATPGGSGAQQFTGPFAPFYNFEPCGLAANETTGVTLLIFNVSGQLRLLLYDATAQVTASQVYHSNINYPIG